MGILIVNSNGFVIEMLGKKATSLPTESAL